jgi:hypothetical protein
MEEVLASVYSGEVGGEVGADPPIMRWQRISRHCDASATQHYCHLEQSISNLLETTKCCNLGLSRYGGWGAMEHKAHLSL